jgi:hypothetical protein
MFLFLVPVLVIQGLGYSLFISTIDMCTDVKNIVDKNIEPKYKSGVGFYITCPPKEIRKNIYSTKFIISKSYDILFNDLNEKVLPVFSKGLARKKRNNDYLLSLKNYFKQNETISNGFEALINFNNILSGLESIGSCEYSKNSINYIEEKLCYKNLRGQMDAFIYYSIGSLGVLLVSIALNKLSVFTREKVKNLILLYFLIFSGYKRRIF